MGFDGAQFIGNPRHSIHDAGFFILTECAGACVAHFQETGCAVAAHAGQDHTDRVAAGEFGDGIEQHIDRGAMAVDRVAIDKAAAGRGRIGDLQMTLATRRQIDLADLQARAVRRFCTVGRAEAVQPLGRSSW